MTIITQKTEKGAELNFAFNTTGREMTIHFFDDKGSIKTALTEKNATIDPEKLKAIPCKSIFENSTALDLAEMYAGFMEATDQLSNNNFDIIFDEETDKLIKLIETNDIPGVTVVDITKENEIEVTMASPEETDLAS